MKRQPGFSIIESLLILVALVIVVAVGYLAYTNLIVPTNKDTQRTEKAQTAAASQPVKVNDTKDLDAVSTQLDQMTVDDSSDSAQLDSAANSFN
jgi:Tfp pilus assembly protein PilE